jgi:hypothetical protein
MQSTLARWIGRHARIQAVLSFGTIGAAIGAAVLITSHASDAALLRSGDSAAVLLGRDDDNLANPAIQPPNVAANQSLNNTDVQVGGAGNDILAGLLGSDVMLGGGGNDIIIGGPEGGVAPNSDVMFGDDGNDINIWAPGDGSDAFIGGNGVDTLVFGVIDRANGVPTAGPSAPGFSVVPTANVSGQGGFCTIERSPDPTYDFLVRFFVRATGALAVTIRTQGVERLLCTSQAGGQITFADLTSPTPAFIIVTQGQIAAADPVLGAIVR